MTAGVGGVPAAPTDGVRDWLDGLDAAHAAAAVGSLRVGEHYGIHLYAGQEPVGTTLKAKDAALIVAAVNAQPALVASLRAVLDLADVLDGIEGGVQPRSVARRLRAVLGPAPDGRRDT